MRSAPFVHSVDALNPQIFTVFSHPFILTSIGRRDGKISFSCIINNTTSKRRVAKIFQETRKSDGKTAET
jgi:hypothetical protein